MCNTDRDPNKGKEKVDEDPIVNFKTMEIQKNANKRKAIVIVESDNVDAGEEESTNSSKGMSPFLLFGFIIDPNNGIKQAYSCNFCSRKFVSPQAFGGHQNCHRLEKRLKKRIEDMNNEWINYLNGNQGVYGYQYNGYDNMIQLVASSNFNAGNLLGELHHIPQIDEVINEAGQGTMSQQITMTKIDHGSISNESADNGDAELEDKEIEKEEIDLTLKL